MERNLGLTFTALSRVPAITGIALWRPFSMDRIARLGGMPSMVARKREDARLAAKEADLLAFLEATDYGGVDAFAHFGKSE